MDTTELRYADGPSTSVELAIAATPEALWPLVTDINLSAKFSNEFKGAEWLDGATTAALGARFLGRNAHPTGRSWQTTSTVVQFEPLQRFGWVVEDVANPTATWLFELRPFEGGTVVSYTGQIGPGPSGLSPAIEAMPDKEHKIIVRRLREHEANMTATLEGIRSLAQGSSPD